MNIEWEEAAFEKIYDDPDVLKNRMSFVVSNKQLPCDDEMIFIAKAFGVNGKRNGLYSSSVQKTTFPCSFVGEYTNTTWYPPSCVSTTPAPTTEGSTPAEFTRCHPGASFVFLSIFCYADY